MARRWVESAGGETERLTGQVTRNDGINRRRDELRAALVSVNHVVVNGAIAQLDCGDRQSRGKESHEDGQAGLGDLAAASGTPSGVRA